MGGWDKSRWKQGKKCLLQQTTNTRKINKMVEIKEAQPKMTVFSWEYLSLITLDTPWLSILLTPIVLVLLWGIWMKVVRNYFNNPLKQPAMSLEDAYANAVISDALDTDDEAEAEEPKKSDLNAEPAAEVEEKKDV